MNTFFKYNDNVVAVFIAMPEYATMADSIDIVMDAWS